MDKRKHPKKGVVVPGAKRRHPVRAPTMNMHNEHTAYIEGLIVENQELKDRIAELEQKVSVFAYEATPKLRERVAKLEEIHHTHEGPGVPQK